MTVGELIERLNDVPKDYIVTFPYYNDYIESYVEEIVGSVSVYPYDKIIYLSW